ncbi:hypothetical protein Save01_01377 [Streptomyces avermitilis]
MAKPSGVVEVLSLHRTEIFVDHCNARLIVHGGRLLFEAWGRGRGAAGPRGGPHHPNPTPQPTPPAPPPPPGGFWRGPGCF